MSSRVSQLERFYNLLERLDDGIGGKRTLDSCDGRMEWPNRGVYFFFESGEERSDTGSGPRVVRVGTHALKTGSGTTLWKRLSQHKGTVRTGGGNHRGSIFRLIVGTALIERHGLSFETWDNRRIGASREIRQGELPLEQQVSATIGSMPFLWLPVDDLPGPESERGVIERGAIALLSNWKQDGIDPPSRSWLGMDCNRARVRGSGLWNANHVDEKYDPAFLDVMEKHVQSAID